MNDCRCHTKPGYWLRADIPVLPEERRKAERDRALLREYHARGRSKDRAYREDMERAGYLGRVAEYVVGRVLHQRVGRIVTVGALPRHLPDLEGGVGVRWSSTDYLLFRGARYADRLDPADEPQVLVQGDDQQMALLGWAAFGEVDREADWSERWECWRIHLSRLHLLPVPPGDKRPISARHDV